MKHSQPKESEHAPRPRTRRTSRSHRPPGRQDRGRGESRDARTFSCREDRGRRGSRHAGTRRPPTDLSQAATSIDRGGSRGRAFSLPGPRGRSGPVGGCSRSQASVRGLIPDESSGRLGVAPGADELREARRGDRRRAVSSSPPRWTYGFAQRIRTPPDTSRYGPIRVVRQSVGGSTGSRLGTGGRRGPRHRLPTSKLVGPPSWARQYGALRVSANL